MNLPQIPVPELVVGSIAIYIVYHFWAVAVSIQYTVNTTTPPDVALMISSAILILILGLYLLLGVYCYLIVLDRVARWIMKELKWS